MTPPGAPPGDPGEAASGDVTGLAGADAGPRRAEHRLKTAVTEDGFEVPAPMAQVRSDVDHISEFFHSIHSRYVWAGIALLVATAVIGTVVAATTPMRDWYMHGAMYAVVFLFIMFYLRAHQLRRRFARAVYAVFASALIAFFVWVLVDLVAPRLEVIEGAITGAGGEAAIGPVLAQRPVAAWLYAPIVMLAAVGVWLLFHWVVVTRYHREDGSEVL
ncbi:MAG: hypothetical protein CVU56_05800 [Deltaproteobacteria bacterium HGW-Deltaproteobacteria-14]|jgi:hypothetical protein|nr:MAG: hypothetical protein CVU56_05800 [Deltaproteobacteria bacterium HGW-Deltaproteobacteria-14]